MGLGQFGRRNLLEKFNMSFRHWNYIGASFQAPRVSPRQRPMEMHHVSLIEVVFQYASMTNHRYLQN